MSKTKLPIQVYKEFMQSIMQDTEDWKDFFAENIVINAPIARLKGKQASIDMHEAFYETVERSIAKVLIEHDELIITQVETTIETKIGHSVTLNMNEWYTIRNGKIEELVIYFDTCALTALDKELYSHYMQH